MSMRHPAVCALPALCLALAACSDDAGGDPGIEGAPSTGQQLEKDASRPLTGDLAGGGSGRADAAPPAPAPPPRLEPSDFEYLGAFRLPSAFDYGARGMTFRPGGGAGSGTLLITGPEAKPVEFGEVSIPEPSSERTYESLPEASVIQDVRSFDGELVETNLDRDTTYGGAIEYVPAQGDQSTDKVYGAADWWYAVADDTFPTVWFSEVDGSNPRGLWHVGPERQPFHGNRIGDYMFTLPAAWADQFTDGRRLVAGKTRGAFGGSMGPTLFAFHAWAEEDPTGALDGFPECAGPNVGDPAYCDFTGFTMCDKWLGGAFVESGDKKAVLLLGMKGLGTANGPNYYDDAPEGACSIYRGYHCDPYERQVIFYDTAELADVVAGRRDAPQVLPYAVWRPDAFLLQGEVCGDAGGMAHDPETGRVFMVERGVGGLKSGNAVHVFRVAP
jgi:hypothetical protein